MRKLHFGVALLVMSVGLWAGTAEALTDEEECEIRKMRAAKKREACLGTQKIKEVQGRSFDLERCETNFDEAIARADARAVDDGVECRYLDLSPTVFDLDTLLEWQKSTDDGDPVLDKDETFTWSATGTKPDGEVYVDFLGGLNACEAATGGGPITGGFEGHCDWRLPTIVELQTILLEPFPCGTSPCIDPIFGPTAASFYWSSTSDANDPDFAWSVSFVDGGVGTGGKGGFHTRAVRGGRD